MYSSLNLQCFRNLYVLGKKSSVLQKAKVNILENETCKTWYKSQGKKTKIQETQMCAGHEQGGIDACWVTLISLLGHTKPFKSNLVLIYTMRVHQSVYKLVHTSRSKMYN